MQPLIMGLFLGYQRCRRITQENGRAVALIDTATKSSPKLAIAKCSNMKLHKRQLELRPFNDTQAPSLAVTGPHPIRDIYTCVLTAAVFMITKIWNQ